MYETEDHTELRGDDAAVAWAVNKSWYNSDAMMHTETVLWHAGASLDRTRAMVNQMIEAAKDFNPAVLAELAAIPEDEYRKYLIILRYPNDVARHLI